VQIVIGAKRESDFTDPIGMLSDCHRRIERFLEVLAAIATQAQGGPLAETQRAAFETALRYFREAAPKHTADEEESLFPRLHSLNRPGLSALLARIEDLSQDHVRAEMDHQEVDRLGQSWLANGQLSVQEASQLVAVLARLRKLHQSHIAIEDNEVFPHAARLLSAVDRDAVGREMAFRRGLKAVPADSL
jgi:hemerythrin-like domain-containing protein